MKFTRFGVLSPQKQINYGGDNFHSPPCKYGFYAFPNIKVELFLLSATDTVGNSSNKSAWVLDKKGKKVKWLDFYIPDDRSRTQKATEGDTLPQIQKEFIPFLRKNNVKLRYIRTEPGTDYIFYLKSPKHFEFNGEVWHHLKDYVDVVDIISEIRDWVKTDMKTYAKALKKCDAKEKYKSAIKEDNFKGDLSRYVAHNSRDHYEVFIEKLD